MTVAPWLERCAASLGGATAAPFRPGEDGRIRGTTDDGIGWDLRVIAGFSSRSDDEPHHLFWRSAAVRSEAVVAVIGNGGSWDDLGRWHAGIGLPPDELEGYLGLLDEMGDLAGALVARPDAGRFPDRGADFTSLDRVAAELANAPVLQFARAATPVELPRSVGRLGWWMLIAGPRGAELLATPLLDALAIWSEHLVSGPTDVRIWVGAPDLRIEAMITDPLPEAYGAIVQIGCAVARGAAHAQGRHEV